MDNLYIQEKMVNYVNSHSELKGKSEQVILSAMVENGVISRTEYAQASGNSAFGTGFSCNDSMGLSVEHSDETLIEPSEFDLTDDYVLKYDNERIQSRKSRNGDEKTNYTYLRNDEGIDYVVIETVMADGTKVTTTALNVNQSTGDVENSDFIFKTIIKPDGTTIFVSPEEFLNGAIHEEIVKDDKVTTNIYNTSNISDYDNQKAHKLYQQIATKDKTYEISYDGKGNSYVVLQNGDCQERLQRNFNVSRRQLDALNGTNFNYKHMQVGEIILIPGEIAADDKSVKNRKTSAEAKQAFFNWSVKHEQANLFACTLSEHTIKKKHTSVESLAREILPNGSKEQIRTLALRIQMLNPNITKKLKPGQKIVVALEGDNNARDIAKSAGFAPTQANNAFYKILNGLPKADRDKVIAEIQACKRQNITDLTEIKKRVFDKTGISVFDSGKTVMNGNKKVPVELVLKDNIGLAMGEIVQSRLVLLPQETLDKIDVNKVLTNLSKMKDKNGNISLDQVFRAFELAGVSILTKDEVVKGSVNIAGVECPIPNIKDMRTKNLVTNVVTAQYDLVIDMLKQYKNNSGVIDKLFEVCPKISDSILGTEKSVDSWIKHLEGEKARLVGEMEKRMNAGEITNSFKDLFAATTGVSFNQANIDAFAKLLEEDVDPTSTKYQNAYKKAFGTRLVDDVTDCIDHKTFWANLGKITIAVYSIANPYARGFTGSVASGLGRLGFGQLTSAAIANGVTMGLSTATIEGVDLAVKDAPISPQDISNYIQSVAISTGFGVFAGGMSPVFQKVCSSVSTKAAAAFPKLFKAPDVKKLDAVTKALEGGKVVSGAELMSTYLSKSGSNIAGKTVEFLTEVVAFSGYSITAGTLAKLAAELFDKDGTLKSQYDNEKSLGDKILEELGNQTKGLLTCQGLTKLLMAFCSKKNVNAVMMQEKLSGFESLKNIEFKYTDIGGKKVLVAKTPKGTIKVSSVAKAIEICESGMLAEGAIVDAYAAEQQKTESTEKQNTTQTNQAPNFEQQRAALKSSNSAREVVDAEGNKILIVHRNAANLGDFTFYKFDANGNFIETGKVSKSNLKQQFGKSFDEFSRLKTPESGGSAYCFVEPITPAVIAAWKGVIEPLFNSAKINMQHAKFKNINDPITKLAAGFGVDINNPKAINEFRSKIKDIQVEGKSPDQLISELMNLNLVQPEFIRNLKETSPNFEADLNYMLRSYDISISEFNEYFSDPRFERFSANDILNEVYKINETLKLDGRFELFKFTFAEKAKIYKALKSGDTNTICDILADKNLDLAVNLEGLWNSNNMYAIRQKSEQLSYNSPTNNYTEYNINGKPTRVYSTGSGSYNKKVEGEPFKAVLKSNMVTKEVVEAILNDIEHFPTIKSMLDKEVPNFKVKTADGKTLDDAPYLKPDGSVYTYRDLLQKAKTDFASLNTQEIHEITIRLSKNLTAPELKLLSENPTVQNQAKQAMSIVQRMRSSTTNKNCIVDDHFYMRMIDRNLTAGFMTDANGVTKAVDMNNIIDAVYQKAVAANKPGQFEVYVVINNKEIKCKVKNSGGKITLETIIGD